MAALQLQSGPVSVASSKFRQHSADIVAHEVKVGPRMLPDGAKPVASGFETFTYPKLVRARVIAST